MGTAPHRTIPSRMPTQLPGEPIPGPTPLSLLQSSFRDLHRDRLYGFALLLTLGDERLAAQATVGALVDGARDVTEHRYPERAAVWLRARVLRRVRRWRSPASSRSATALEPLGVGERAFSGLEALSLRERAALVAIDVEQFDDGDAATVLDLRPASLLEVVRRARRRYLAAATATATDVDHADGPVRSRVRRAASRALSR